MNTAHFSLKCSQNCSCSRAIRGNHLRQGQVKCLFWSGKLWFFFKHYSQNGRESSESFARELQCNLHFGESRCVLSVSDKDFCYSKWKWRTAKFSACLATIASFCCLSSEVSLIFALKIAHFVSEIEFVRLKLHFPKAEFWFSFQQTASRWELSGCLHSFSFAPCLPCMSGTDWKFSS